MKSENAANAEDRFKAWAERRRDDAQGRRGDAEI